MSTSQSKRPIIATEGMGGLGRVAPGTRLAVRVATDDEIAAQWKQLSKYGEPTISPYAFLVCWADAPEQVLYDWFSPVGGWYRDQALEAAQKYADARGAEVVDA